MRKIGNLADRIDSLTPARTAFAVKTLEYNSSLEVPPRLMIVCLSINDSDNRIGFSQNRQETPRKLAWIAAACISTPNGSVLDRGLNPTIYERGDRVE
jgi:hypothetical protein